MSGALIHYADILNRWEDPSAALLNHILTEKVKPLFRSSPHPRLNLATGRALSRPAGGPDSVFDYYEGQTWKAHPGASNIVLWCVQHIKVCHTQTSTYQLIPYMRYRSERRLRKIVASHDTSNYDPLR
jgi:hypothetical protein